MLSQKFKSTNMQDGIVQVPRIETAFCERHSYFCAMMQELNKSDYWWLRSLFPCS